MNEEQISWNYKNAMDRIKGTDDEKAAAAALFDKNTVSAKKSGRFNGIPRIAAAVIAVFAVIVLGGATAMAVTGRFTVRDFYFTNSDRKFDEYFTNEQKEYPVGDYKFIYEGSIYDESTKQGALNFSLCDLQGQPVKIGESSIQPVGKAPNYYTLGIKTFCCRFGKDEIYILFNNVGSVYARTIENGLFFAFSKFDRDELQYGDFQLMILSKDEYNSLHAELDELDDTDLMSVARDPASDEITVDFDRELTQSRLSAILNKYNPQSITNIAPPAQVIQAENLKLTIGRVNILLEYNNDECTVTDFTMIREDGTKTVFHYSDHLWTVEGMVENLLPSTAYDDDRICTSGVNFGFILGDDEKVTIEANGNTYK